MKNKPTLVFVHGAFSSTRAFNYFKFKFPDYPQLSFTYDWNDSPMVVGKDLAKFVAENAKTPEVILMGHSLGGNVSIHSLPHFQQNGPTVLKVFTYGSPLGGSQHALLIGMFSSASVFGHLRPTSVDIRSLKKVAQSHPIITSFVTSKGPLSNSNDGVITVKSQTAIKGLRYVPVATNHMEVLLCDTVIDTTRTIIET